MSRAMAALFLAGCLTPLPDTGTDGTVDEPFILGWTNQCPSTETWHGEANVQGASNGTAILNFWDTGTANGWNEEHTLVGAGATRTGTGSGGSGGGVENELMNVVLTHVETQAEVSDAGTGTGTTWFGCGPQDTFNLGVLTFAVRVHDTSGRLADCVAFGQDPATIVAGAYTTQGGVPSNADELSSCRTTSF